MIKRGRHLAKDPKTPKVTDEPTLLWPIYATSHRSASSTCDCSAKIWHPDFHQSGWGFEPFGCVLILKPKFSRSSDFSWVLSLGLLLSLTLSFDILGVNEESCFSFLRFIDVSPAEMANLMLQGLLTRWEVCSLFGERAFGNKWGQMLSTVKLNIWCYIILEKPLILLRIKIFIRES